jgi:hypothetical protein
MRQVLTIVILVLAIASQCGAQVDCASFDTAINSALKLISRERAGGITDNSAPRETMRAAKINNYLQVISINLMLMKENRCPLRKRPISLGEYMKEALECELAQMKGEKDPPTCKLDTWKGEDAKQKPIPAEEQGAPPGPK